jgi:hypothetical protein
MFNIKIIIVVVIIIIIIIIIIMTHMGVSEGWEECASRLVKGIGVSEYLDKGSSL